MPFSLTAAQSEWVSEWVLRVSVCCGVVILVLIPIPIPILFHVLVHLVVSLWHVLHILALQNVTRSQRSSLLWLLKWILRSAMINWGFSAGQTSELDPDPRTRVSVTLPKLRGFNPRQLHSTTHGAVRLHQDASRWEVAKCHLQFDKPVQPAMSPCVCVRECVVAAPWETS